VSDAASYSFLPWVRRGLSSLARTVPTENFLGMQVSLTVNSVAAGQVGVRLHGPGQVTGIDPRTIVRTEPRANTTTFEPNYLAAIEFATADFPWLFTPVLAAGAELGPWLCLIVVREQPGVTFLRRARALPLIQFLDPAVPLDELPNLNQIKTWAHAQIVGAAATTDDAVRGALDGPSSAYISRIVCPRKLDPSASYIACLVPTYHVGAQIGIAPELPVDDADVAPAWDASVSAPFALPVYSSWRFSTSADGDFAALARRLRPPTEPLQLGRRDMDVSRAGFGLREFSGLVLGLEGALRSPETVPSMWPDGMQQQFEEALRPILSPQSGPVPVVSPPVYAQVPTGLPLPGPAGTPIWMRELNLDPRWRAAAGMGTEIVRADQEALMASAWDQYEAVRRANQLLRQMQLARAVTKAARAKHFAVGVIDGPGALLQLTRPLHARLRLDPSMPVTLHAQVAASRVPSGAVSAAFRRLARRRGPVGRRLFATGTRSRIVERLNAAPGTADAVVAMSPRVPPEGVVLLDAISPQTTSADLTPTAITRAEGWPGPSSGGGTLPVTAIARHAGTPPSWATDGGTAFPISPDVPGDVAANKEMSLRFRAAATAVTTYVATRTARILDAPDRPPLATALALIQSQTLDAVDPEVTIVVRARAQLVLPTTGDPLRPLLTEPVFPQPMSRELKPQLLLPGVDRVPPETAAMLVTNPTFVEAFMVGLNDEMRREFAWRQYPTDQRGTFFTRFWGTGAGAASAEDIAPIATWDPSLHLGDNAIAQGDQAVLLLRGTLLRRYPNTIISAVQAVAPNGVRTLSATELFPIFRGSIDADMVFFGFALSKAAAVAGEGWYFVLAEHPSEPRFGFERAAMAGPLTTWNDLPWPQVGVTHNHVDLDAPPPAASLEGATWNADSAQQAFITFRRPVRLALHATALLG
jgi:hypothetical protein